MHPTHWLISTQVLEIKDRDPRVGRIEADVSSAAELKKVEAIKARDGRVRGVLVDVVWPCRASPEPFLSRITAL